MSGQGQVMSSSEVDFGQFYFRDADFWDLYAGHCTGHFVGEFGQRIFSWRVCRHDIFIVNDSELIQSIIEPICKLLVSHSRFSIGIDCCQVVIIVVQGQLCCCQSGYCSSQAVSCHVDQSPGVFLKQQVQVFFCELELSIKGLVKSFMDPAALAIGIGNISHIQICTKIFKTCRLRSSEHNDDGFQVGRVSDHSKQVQRFDFPSLAVGEQVFMALIAGPALELGQGFIDHDGVDGKFSGGGRNVLAAVDQQSCQEKQKKSIHDLNDKRNLRFSIQNKPIALSVPLMGYRQM